MTSTAQTAVSIYLTALQDPNALVNSQAIADLSAKLEESADPLERLALRQELFNAQEPPSLQVLEAEFITHARAWADERGISPKVFLVEGVSPTVLRRAGFAMPKARGARVDRKPAPKRVTAEQVLAVMPTIGTFTIQQLAARSGATMATVRKIVQQQVDGGKLQQLGADPTHQGVGRAPGLYQAM
ncbi:MAG: hypothetical protein ACRDZO_14540 [Egibacteraceae bacterium]